MSKSPQAGELRERLQPQEPPRPQAGAQQRDPGDPLAYLEHLARFGQRLGLERMEALLAALGNPHRSYPVVHIAGTNGKGSTSAMVAAILQAAGYRVGLYTSPHLVRFGERMQVNGEAATEAQLAELVGIVRPVAQRVAGSGEAPTQFEVGTAMAMLHFARSRVEVAVLEVGMGGRLDATNVVAPEVAAITPVSLEHTQVLGPTVEAIAQEKAGILKAGRPAVIAPQAPEAARVVAARAAELGCPLVWVGQDVEWDEEEVSPERWGGRLSIRRTPGGWCLERLEVGLAGRHQLQNAAVAVALADQLARLGPWRIPEAAIRSGLAGVRWPARLQLLRRSPLVLLDGAHNPAAASVLAQALRDLLPGRRPVLVMGVLAEKDVEGLLRPLLPLAAGLVATRPAGGRTAPLDADALAGRARAISGGTLPVRAVVPALEAVRVAVEQAGPEGAVCICGSLYLAGEVLAQWAGEESPGMKPYSFGEGPKKGA